MHVIETPAFPLFDLRRLWDVKLTLSRRGTLYRCMLMLMSFGYLLYHVQRVTAGSCSGLIVPVAYSYIIGIF